MATENGQEAADLNEQLLREPYRFDFFQAVRLLNRLCQEVTGQAPTEVRYPVGHDATADQEIVRFRVPATLRFPTAAIARLQQKPTPVPLEMSVTFFGLTGALGALPFHYTTTILQRARLRDFSLREFLDLFHHRLVSLFYRAWEKYRLPFVYERCRLEKAAVDPITSLLSSLIGFGTAGLADRLDVDDRLLLYYAGHFAHQIRSAVCLEAILRGFLRVQVYIIQAQARWIRLERDECTLLPMPGQPTGSNTQLGIDAIAGERFRDVQGKFRIRVGPLGRAQFRRFLPGGPALHPLCQLTRTYVGVEFDFDVQVVLLPNEVPQAQLTNESTDSPRLGWNVWLCCRQFDRPVDDAVFQVPDL